MKPSRAEVWCAIEIALATVLIFVPSILTFRASAPATPDLSHSTSGPLGLGPEWWVAIFTGVLTIATIGLWRATNQLGERTDRGMRTLESAYPFPVVASAHDLANQIEAALGFGDPGHTQRIGIAFTLQNFGKTPCSILHVEADLYIQDRVFSATRQAPRELILGAGQQTSVLSAQTEITRSEAGNIVMHAATLLFAGFINYLDIWGGQKSERFVWRYDHSLRSLVPIPQPTSTFGSRTS